VGTVICAYAAVVTRGVNGQHNQVTLSPACACGYLCRTALPPYALLPPLRLRAYTTTLPQRICCLYHHSYRARPFYLPYRLHTPACCLHAHTGGSPYPLRAYHLPPFAGLRIPFCGSLPAAYTHWFLYRCGSAFCVACDTLNTPRAATPCRARSKRGWEEEEERNTEEEGDEEEEMKRRERREAERGR